MIRCLIILAATLMAPILANADNYYCDGSIKQPCLVSDIDNPEESVKNWRTMRMLAQSYPGNITGLVNMRASGSAAITAQGFDTIKNRVNSTSDTRHTRLIDLDLREESHVYLNKDSVTLMSDNDWINLGKDHHHSMISELLWIHSLQQHKYLSGVLTSTQFKEHQLDQGVHVIVESINSEKTVAEDRGYIYYRLTVTDHMAPRDEEVDRFIAFLKTINPTDWLHIHCRGGEGRTTTFLAMYDMLLNADQVPFDDIIKRQASVEPYYDLSVITRRNPDLSIYYEKRLLFLKQFYQFALEYKHNQTLSWTQWKQSR